MICVMRWIARHRVVVLLLTSMTVWLGLDAMTVTASPVRRGSTYVGTGRDPVGSLVVQFFVSRDGRSVVHLEVWDLPVACKGRGRSALPSLPFADVVRIRRDGTFRTAFGTPDVPSPLTLTGRFVSHGRASGTVRYRGRGPDKRCTAEGIWTAQTSPPRPPVQHFAGTTSEGTPVTFERTIERHPRVTHFDFGLLGARFPDGDSCGPTRVATGRVVVPPYVGPEFALPVLHHGRFYGGYGGGMGIDYAVGIRGRFGANDQASGTFNYVDRADCKTGNVHWTAHRAG
jgi:hypothetical protein